MYNQDILDTKLVLYTENDKTQTSYTMKYYSAVVEFTSLNLCQNILYVNRYYLKIINIYMYISDQVSIIIYGAQYLL